MTTRTNVGDLLRRARIHRALSQRDLASRSKISQSVLSYYESGRTRPSRDVLSRLEHALDLPEGQLVQAGTEIATRSTSPPRPIEAELPRAAFLRSLEAAQWRSAVVDRPAGTDGGDLAFAVDLRSSVFLVLLDAQGSGEIAAPLGRIAASCVFGATVLPGGGVPTPEDIIDVLVRFWRFLGEPIERTSACVVRFDRRERRLTQCRLNMPPPFLRSGRLVQWTGNPGGPAGSFTGERVLDENALLVLATDGLASLPTRGAKTLWDSPELRYVLNSAKDPRDVAFALEGRLRDDDGHGRRDDRLAIAVMP